MSARIAFISHASALEGAERSLLELAKSFKENGHSVVVVVPKKGELSSELAGQQIPWIKAKIEWWKSDGSSLDQNWVLRNRINADKIASILASFKPELIYSNTSVIGVGALVAGILNIPHIQHIRELASGKIFDQYRETLDALGAIIGSLSTLVMYNSEATKDSWKPYIKGKTKVVYNPLKLSSQGLIKSVGSQSLVMIGSVLPIKNQLLAVQVLHELKASGLNMDLKLIGPVVKENYKKEVDQFIVSHNLQKEVNWVGFKKDPWSLVKENDIVFSPGNQEGFGRVIAEALLLGLRVVAVEGGASNELLEGLKEPSLVGTNPQKIAKFISEQHSDSDHPELRRERINHIGKIVSHERQLKALVNTILEQLDQTNPVLQFVDPFTDHTAHLKYIPRKVILKYLVNPAAE